MNPGNENRKIAVFCAPGLDAHLTSVTDYLKGNYETKICLGMNHQKIDKMIAWADTIWIEWADQNAVNILNVPGRLFGKQVILRIHSYEIFTPFLDFIPWSSVTDLIFVADHVRNIVLEKFPKVQGAVRNIHVIPNGIDIEKFKMKMFDQPKASRAGNASPNKKIAYLGHVNHKKAPLLFLNAFQELLKIDSGFTLHIGGEYQDERYALYVKQLIESNPSLKDRIFFEGWIEKPEEWLQDKSFIICSSVFESQNKGVMEAMAMGIKPLIHNFVGAENIYPKWHIWNTVTQFCNMILNDDYKPLDYRNFIAENFSLERQNESIGKVLEEKVGQPEIFYPNDQPLPAIAISACMIMKNEEANIERCLKSLEGLVDEIIIVDTGSTDKSVSIAEKYRVRIYHHAWQDDFSYHRNQSINYATGDWLLVIDADEQLDGDKEGLRRCLERLKPEYNGVAVKLRDVCPRSGVQFNATRIFRKGTIEYRRAAHNIPVCQGISQVGAILFDGAEIVHHGSHYQISEEASKKKATRTEELLLKSLASDENDHEIHFYLMQLYGTKKEYDRAIMHGWEYLNHKREIAEFNNSVYYSMIRMYMELEKMDEALDCLRQAEIVLPADLDIAYVTVELGVLISRGDLILQGARKYLRLYDLYHERPDAKGSRFIFSLKPDCLYFCLYHMASYLLQDGVACLAKLKKAIPFLTEQKERDEAVKEVTKMLSAIGVETN